MSNITDIRFRVNESMLVLQVKEIEERSGYGYSTANWRDAKVEDLLDVSPFIKTRVLSDIRDQIDSLQRDLEHIDRNKGVQVASFEQPWTRS